MQTITSYIRATIITLAIALLPACSEEPVDAVPCEGAGGDAGAASSSSGSGGAGGSGGFEPVTIEIDRAELMKVNSWCIGPYLWPNTVRDVLKYGEPHAYCACNVDSSCQITGAPAEAHCGMYMKEIANGTLMPFFPDHAYGQVTHEDGRPYICLLDGTTPAR